MTAPTDLGRGVWLVTGLLGLGLAGLCALLRGPADALGALVGSGLMLLNFGGLTWAAERALAGRAASRPVWIGASRLRLGLLAALLACAACSSDSDSDSSAESAATTSTTRPVATTTTAAPTTTTTTTVPPPVVNANLAEDVFAYGPDFHGSTGSIALAARIVDVVATPTGGGYWLLSADGGVFTYGDATFAGTASGFEAVALAPTATASWPAARCVVPLTRPRMKRSWAAFSVPRMTAICSSQSSRVVVATRVALSAAWVTGCLFPRWC